MYRVLDQPEFADFYLPFGGKLDLQNRWVKLASIIPWKTLEGDYSLHFADSGMGAPALSCRIALGALIIKERLTLTDEETVAQIRENPYLQYFLGLREYLQENLFDPSMMVHFRKRISPEMLKRVNNAIITQNQPTQNTNPNDPSNPPHNHDDPTAPPLPPPASSETPPTPAPNNGKLLIDATCTPADITYPTDLKLLNEAREKSEHIIDVLHRTLPHKTPKPRTYRQKARKDYLNLVLNKKPKPNKIRTAIGKQLRYLKRNLGHINQLLDNGAQLHRLKRYWRKCLMVIHTLYDQQNHMYQNRIHRVDDRIVSISQPHIRPIVRGKAAQSVEFGAKISVSYVNGYVTLHRISYDAYNETNDLPQQAETYRKTYGCYPQSIHADKIYQTRANRAWCKERDIRLSGKPLGRPRQMSAEEKKQQRRDETDRIPIEGKFGNSKRKGTLDRIMAKLADTGLTVIGVGILVMNLDHLLRQLCALIGRLIITLELPRLNNQRTKDHTSRFLSKWHIPPAACCAA